MGGNSGSGHRGREAEDLALGHLLQRGLRLRERNYRCRRGEIDLVMDEAGTTVFVEVRYRARADYGDAAQSVDARKQGRLGAAAQHYLAAHAQWALRPCRFDVVAVSGATGSCQVSWIRDAFRR
jgi:putative endonuclease